ncbi:hypothetical protein JHK87_004180 [Glycine soja]|nr:hypothetical protein JHK87_004180 [Glycine soja]
MSAFSPSQAKEQDDDTQHLWTYVTKIKSVAGGGNYEIKCNICDFTFNGSYTRVRAHLLKMTRKGVRVCQKVKVAKLIDLKKIDNEATLRVESIEKCMCKEEERLTSEEAHAKAAEAAQKRSGATQEISSGQQTGMGSEYYQSSMQFGDLSSLEQPGFPRNNQDVHNWVFNLHFTPPLDQQSCGRPLLTSRMHVWTIELSQALLGAPDPLKLPAFAAPHLDAYDQHMTILKTFGPPLQWMECRSHANEVTFYYKSYDKIWRLP